MPKRRQKLASNVVGAALIRDQIRIAKGKREQVAQMKGEEAALLKSSASAGFNSVSVTEQSTLDDFLAQATLANRDFTAIKETQIVVLDDHGVAKTSGLVEDAAQLAEDRKKRAQLFQLLREGGYRHLPIPRRPTWVKGTTTKEELDEMERRSFLEWRRGIAQLENEQAGLQVTPFEKNIQYWRQLWRVVERSDLLIQVVDARNPLLFRCRDLEDWINSMPGKKGNFLLLNKADFLSKSLRREWADYFNREGIPFCFFSAKREQIRIDSGNPILEEEEEEQSFDETTVLNRKQLIRKIAKHLAECGEKGDQSPTIGTVGYPNVGKSSVINVLLLASANDHTTQRVSVSATPGHTKHFQTLVVYEDREKSATPAMTLCDCPGLVFPCFLGSKAEMLCFGILPIDEIRGRDWFAAIELVCDNIPRDAFEKEYAIHIGKAWDGNQLTNILARRIGASAKGESKYNRATRLIEAFCTTKNLMAGGGSGSRLDEGKAARTILKDVVAGKLVWCEGVPKTDADTQAHYDNLQASLEKAEQQKAAASGVVIQGDDDLLRPSNSSTINRRSAADGNDATESSTYHFFDPSNPDAVLAEEDDIAQLNDFEEEEDEEQDDTNDLTEADDSNDAENGVEAENGAEEEIDLEQLLVEDLRMMQMNPETQGAKAAAAAAGKLGAAASAALAAGKPVKSKRLLRHGRKHRKARDPEPYALAGASLSAQTPGKFAGEFTRREKYT